VVGTLTLASLRELKMAANAVVGVPVQSMLDADVRIWLKAADCEGERPPCTYKQLRQPSQLEKKPPLHMHSWWAM